MKFAALLALTIIGLTGCNAEHSRASTGSAVAASIQGYTAAQQAQAAQERRGGMCPMLNVFTNDYGVMRDETRVARDLSVPPAPVGAAKPPRKPETVNARK